MAVEHTYLDHGMIERGEKPKIIKPVEAPKTAAAKSRRRAVPLEVSTQDGAMETDAEPQEPEL